MASRSPAKIRVNRPLRRVLLCALLLVFCFLTTACGVKQRPPKAALDLEGGSFIQEGMASWYGRKFHGRKTASGERYNMNGLTCAHKELPLQSMVEVTNLDNGNVVVLRVNDRGPFVAGRIVDVSHQAAKKLGFLLQGVARVRLEWFQDKKEQAEAHGGEELPTEELTETIKEAMHQD